MTTEKEQNWLISYYQYWNATEAARQAGYKWPNKVGPQLKAKFADEIKAHIDELVMSADEALVLLSEQARGSLGDFAKVQVLADLEDHPKARLVKALTSDVYEDKAGKVHYKARIELHDAQSAIINVLKVHGKFKETTTNLNLDLSQLTNEQLQRIAAGEEPTSVLASPTQSGG